jgi:hypothetical protein
MTYKIFINQEKIVTLIPEEDEIKQVAQLQFGDQAIGEINSEAYEDEDEIWPDVLESVSAWCERNSQ